MLKMKTDFLLKAQTTTFTTNNQKRESQKSTCGIFNNFPLSKTLLFQIYNIQKETNDHNEKIYSPKQLSMIAITNTKKKRSE